MMSEVATVLEALQLDEIGPGRFRADNVPHDSGRPVVEGAQMMAQMIVATARSAPGKTTRFISAVFDRPGRTDAPLEIAVDVIHSGRTLVSATATAYQDERVLSRASVLFDAGDEDVIRHSSSAPISPGSPEDATPWTTNASGTLVRIAQGVDIGAAEKNGPPQLLVWFKVPDAPIDPVINQALLTSRSHLFLIPAAMRPHDGMGVGMSHDSLSTGVITHSVSFHDSVDASSWLLFAQESTFAGSGRAYGRGEVFTEDGRLVASFSQNSLIRRFAENFTRRGKTQMSL
jgi:acyl-CoA thioesterase II